MTGRGRGNILKLFQEYTEREADRTAEDSGLGTGTGDANTTLASRSMPSFGRGSLTTSSENNAVRFFLLFDLILIFFLFLGKNPSYFIYINSQFFSRFYK